MLSDARGGAVRALTGGWDRSVAHLSASPDGRTLIVTADEIGQRALFAVDAKTGVVRKLFADGEVEDWRSRATASSSRARIWAVPADLYRVPLAGGSAKRLTDVNAALLAARQMSEFEQFSFQGWNEETVYGYVMKPYGFDAGQRYPIAFVVHGGPQASAWRTSGPTAGTRRRSPAVATRS